MQALEDFQKDYNSVLKARYLAGQIRESHAYLIMIMHAMLMSGDEVLAEPLIATLLSDLSPALSDKEALGNLLGVSCIAGDLLQPSRVLLAEHIRALDVSFFPRNRYQPVLNYLHTLTMRVKHHPLMDVVVAAIDAKKSVFTVAMEMKEETEVDKPSSYVGMLLRMADYARWNQQWRFSLELYSIAFRILPSLEANLIPKHCQIYLARLYYINVFGNGIKTIVKKELGFFQELEKELQSYPGLAFIYAAAEKNIEILHKKLEQAEEIKPTFYRDIITQCLYVVKRHADMQPDVKEEARTMLDHQEHQYSSYRFQQHAEGIERSLLTGVMLSNTAKLVSPVFSQDCAVWDTRLCNHYVRYGQYDKAIIAFKKLLVECKDLLSVMPERLFLVLRDIPASEHVILKTQEFIDFLTPKLLIESEGLRFNQMNKYIHMRVLRMLAIYAWNQGQLKIAHTYAYQAVKTSMKEDLSSLAPYQAVEHYHFNLFVLAAIYLKYKKWDEAMKLIEKIDGNCVTDIAFPIIERRCIELFPLSYPDESVTTLSKTLQQLTSFISKIGKHAPALGEKLQYDLDRLQSQLNILKKKAAKEAKNSNKQPNGEMKEEGRSTQGIHQLLKLELSPMQVADLYEKQKTVLQERMSKALTSTIELHDKANNLLDKYHLLRQPNRAKQLTQVGKFQAEAKEASNEVEQLKQLLVTGQNVDLTTLETSLQQIKTKISVLDRGIDEIKGSLDKTLNKVDASENKSRKFNKFK